MSDKAGIRFTPVQMKKLGRHFWITYVGARTGEHWKRVSRWFVYGQGDEDNKGGHSIYGSYWNRDMALILWVVIRTFTANNDYLSSSEVRAYKARQRSLVKLFGITAIDTLAAISWLEENDH